jgi:hypothetical protein
LIPMGTGTLTLLLIGAWIIGTLLVQPSATD